MTIAGMQKNQKPAPIVRKFQIQAPHGAVIYASTVGVEVQYPDSMEGEIRAWIDSLKESFAMSTQMDNRTMPCPQCGGKGILMNGEHPELCPLCRGLARVTPQESIAYQQGQISFRTNDTTPAPAISPAEPTQVDPPTLIGPVYDPAQAGRGPVTG